MGRKEFDMSTLGGELIVAAGVFAVLVVYSPLVAAAALLIWVGSVAVRWTAQPDLEVIPVRVETRRVQKRRTRR